MPDFETVEVTTDILLCGGGMAACGAAVEASYWANKNGLKVTLVDKAAMDRSGAVAMGLSAINQYVDINSGNNSCEDYVTYVRNDLMGICREDLVYDIAVTLTPAFICSKNGDSPSGWTQTASMCTKVVGSS